MDKKYAIFDLDGTLVDSMVYWENLAKEYLNSKGVKNIPDTISEQIVTMTMTESAVLFQKEFELDGTTDAIAEEMNEMMNEHYRHDIPLKEGVKEYLMLLKDSGMVMCVASATDVPLVQSCLSRLGILDHFSFLLSCEMVGKGKSSPDIYFEAAKRLGALPKDIAVYEDALYAARTAKSASFYVIGVYDDSEKDCFDELTMISDKVIYSWKEEIDLMI